MTRTQRKEIEDRAKALITKCGGVVKAAAKLGVTTITLNNLLLKQRLYTKTMVRLCKKLNYVIDPVDCIPERRPRLQIAAPPVAPKPKSKAAKKKAKPAKKAKSKPKKAKKHPAKKDSNGVAGHAKASPDLIETIPPPALEDVAE